MRSTFLSSSLLVVVIAVGCGGKDTKETPPAETPTGPPPLQGIGTPPITPPAEKKDPPVEKKKTPRIEIANAKITIDGKNVPMPCELADLEKALGKPSGTVDDPVSAKNKYVYWSGFGISASQEKEGKQLVREFHLNFQQTYDLSTKGQTKPFPGEMVLEDQSLTASTVPAELAGKVKQLHTIFGKSLALDYDFPSIRVIINPSDKGLASVTVEQPLAAR